jgi:hypothetical protein
MRIRDWMCPLPYPVKKKYKYLKPSAIPEAKKKVLTIRKKRSGLYITNILIIVKKEIQM